MNNIAIKHSFITLFILLSGCSKFDYNDDGEGINNIDSQIKMEQALIGAYSKFADIFADSRFRNSFILQQMNADDIDFIASISSCENNLINEPKTFITYNENGDSIVLYYGSCRYFHHGNDKDATTDFYMDIINTSYKNMYKAIITQNKIINQFPDISVLNENFKNILGQIYFMRAYTYFRLARVFGEVPLITDTDVNYSTSCASFNEIYQLIVSDMQKAILLLPETKNNEIYTTICPNKGSAIALLAEIYLNMGGFPIKDQSCYKLAAKYAKNVIDSANYYGFYLIKDFADLYSSSYNNNNEIISCIQYKSDFGLDDLSEYMAVFNSNELSYLTYSACAEVKFYNNFPLNHRKKSTFQTGISDFLNPVTHEFIEDTIYPIRTSTAYWLELKKSAFEDSYEYFQKKEWYNIYILRYAHTLLTYAEASARAGELNDMCYEAVNMVRRRANKLPVTAPSKYDLKKGLSTELFIDSVVWERAWEFVGEPEGRWFDLIRLEIIKNINELRDPHESEPPYPEIFKTYFFPIPIEDFLINPNLNNS